MHAYFRRRWVQLAEFFAAILANRTLVAMLPDAEELVVTLLQEFVAAGVSVAIVAILAYGLRPPRATLTWTSKNAPVDGPSLDLQRTGTGMPMFTVELATGGLLSWWVLRGQTHVPVRIELEPPGNVVVERVDESAPPGATEAEPPSAVRFDLRCARGDEKHRARLALRRVGGEREPVGLVVRVADGAPRRVRRFMRIRSEVIRIR